MALAFDPHRSRSAVAGAAVVGLTLVCLAATGETAPLGAAVLALVVLALTVSRPTTAAIVTIALLPWQTVIQAFLYASGAPVGLVRAGALWKEAVLIGLVAAVLIRLRDETLHLDALDALAAVLILVACFYFAFPQIGSVAGRVGPVQERLVALRTAVLHLVLFLVVRRLPFPQRALVATQRWIVRSGLVLAVGVVIESQLPDLWRTISVDTLRVHVFRTDVLGVPTSVYRLLHIGGEAERYGSFFYSPFALAFYLLVAFAVVLHSDRRGWAQLVPLALFGAGILLSGSRATALAAVVVLLLDLVVKARFGGVVKNLVLATIVLAVGIGVASNASIADRFGEAGTASTEGHQSRVTDTLRFLGDDPYGAGLGVSPLTNRFEGGRLDDVPTTAESSYLQVGLEFGIVPMLVFIALCASVVGVGIRRAGGDPHRGAAVLALVGILLTGLVLHVFNGLAVTFAVWLMAGAAVPHEPVSRARPGSRRSAAAPSPPSSGRRPQPTVPVARSGSLR